MQTVALAYGDLYRSLRAMPLLATVLTLIVAAFIPGTWIAVGALIERYPSVFVIGGWPLQLCMDFVIGAVQSFLLTPIMIAIHRFILLDEVTRSYRLRPHDPRFRHFFAWVVGLSALFTLARVIFNLLLSSVSPDIAVYLSSVPLLIALFVTLRLTILFPAIAVSTSRVTAAHAFADTKRHFLRILLIMVLALLPFVALVIAGAWIVSGMATTILALFLAIAVFPLLAAVASRIFQIVADDVVLRRSDQLVPARS